MNFIDIIETQTEGPEEEFNDMRDGFERYIAWAKRNGCDYAYYIMSVPRFVEWYKLCQEFNLNHTEYKGKPIHVMKDEHVLRVFGISGKP